MSKVLTFIDFGLCVDVDINGDNFQEDNTVYQLTEWEHDYEIYQRIGVNQWLKIFGCNEVEGVGQAIALGHYERLGEMSGTYHPLNNPLGVQYRLYNYGCLI